MKKPVKTAKHLHKSVLIQLAGQRQPTALPAADVIHKARQAAQQQQWLNVANWCQQLTQQLPALTDAWLLWFDSLHHLGRYAELQQVAAEALQLKPKFVPALVSLATAQRLLLQHQPALDTIHKALKIEPGNPAVLNHVGILQKEMGRLDESLQTFNRCIAISPSFTEAYWNRADLYLQPTDNDIAAMQSLLQKRGLTPGQKARLHYALARAYEYRGEFDQQFSHVELGASCKRATLDYDHQQDMLQARRVMDIFPQQQLLQQCDGELPPQASTPIFICGLPRSGTTLVEQILSSHPEVMAGDERLDFPRATAECLQRWGLRESYPEWINKVTPAQWQQVGQRYQQLTLPLHERRFFTDKNLQNYKVIGLIQLALPTAKFIFCQRHPMDTLWGCYRQLFGDGLAFTYSQVELADTWNLAQELKHYWQTLLGDRLHIVDYERLIDDQQGITAELLAYVGLPWNDRCLAFHENPRAVRTTSASQVRTPLHSSRIGQWQNFADKLQTMRDHLQWP